MPDCKNAAGLHSKPEMDIIDLIIGSEGILGVITEIEVALNQKPTLMALVVFLPSEDEAISFVEDIRNSSLNPEFIEYFDSNAVNLLRNKQKENPESLPVPPIAEIEEASPIGEASWSLALFHWLLECKPLSI